MSKKKLDTIGVLNELSGQSVFFQQPAETERKSVRNSDRSEIRTKKRTVDLPVRRTTKRYSFEFYEDQILRLRKIKIEAGLEGESIFLSEIVRRALDEYFQNHDTDRTENRSEFRTHGNSFEKPNEKRLA
jgi:hypothetical protein